MFFLYLQSLLDDNCDLNHINTNPEKTFDNNHDKTNVVLEFDQNNHLEDKRKQTHTNCSSYKCNHCQKEFKLNFLLNRHIKKCHIPKNSNSVINMSECSICNNLIEEAHHDDHIKSHKNGTDKNDGYGIFLKLCKLNGVWHKLPTDNIFKCDICIEECSSEVDLIEHMKIHKNNDNQTQPEDRSKSIQVSRLTNNNLEIRDDIPLICEMCNLKFDKKENFDLHVIYCTKSSCHIWSKFLGAQNNVKVTFMCKVCGTDFNNSSLLENHKMSCCKSYNCSFCKNTFDTKDLWSKHLDNCKEYNSVRSSSIHINETPIDDVCNQNVKNNCSLSIRKEKNNYKNVSVKKWSDLIDSTVDSNVSLTKTIPYNCIENNSNYSPSVNIMKNSCLNMVKRKRFDYSSAVRDHKLTGHSSSNSLMVNNCSFNVQKETTLYFNGEESNGSHSPGAVNINETIVQCKPQNLMMHGCNINIKKEMNPCTTVVKRNSYNQINTDNLIRPLLPEDLQHDMIGNEDNIRIKQEKGLRMNAAEVNYFNLANVSNCQTVSSEISKKPMKKEPENSENNEVDEYIERETIYFTIWKTSVGAGNVSYSGNYKSKEQTLQNIIVCECKLCRKSFSDLHSLAVHLSGHKECSMHECVVCDEKFDTVLLWTEHEKYHQQQVDLNSSQTLDNSNSNETYDIENISYSENTEFQIMTTTVIDNRTNESSSGIKRRFQTSSSNVTPNLNNAEKLRKHHSNPTLPHHISTNIVKSFPCNYCDRIFSGQGQLTNHEKSHTNPNKNKSLVQNTNNILKTIESTETQLNMQIENNIVDSISLELGQKKTQNSLPWAPKKFICHYCRKRFTKKCYWTNHIRFVHKINIVPKHTAFKKPASTNNLNNEIGSINNSEQFTDSSQSIESIKEHTNNRSISPSTRLNNFSKNVNKSAYCTICQKQFAHIGALTSHMHVHSNRKPYKCQYCDRKFSMKGPYCIHERNHRNKIAFNNIQVQNSNPDKKPDIEGIEGEQQQIKNENYNSELLDNTMNGNSSCMNFGKRNRMWLVCDVCNKKFSNPPQLILHRKLHHEMVSPYVCNICNKSYKARHLWNSHLISHHGRHININNVKNDLHDSKLDVNSLKSEQHSNIFKCGYCKKEYSLIYHWKRHLSLSKQCRRHCNRNVPEFTSNRAKESYKKSIRFECKICNKTYSTDYNRKVHIINIHKVAPALLKNYKENLNVQTQEPSSSTAVETPTPEESNIPNQKKRGRQPNPNNNIAFKCNICGNCYSNKNNLTRHYNIIHLKINDIITCDICGRTFKYKYSYQEHCKTKHGIGLRARTPTNIDIKNNMNKQVVTTDKNITTMQYSCKICKVKFPDNIALQKHIEIQHTVNKYKCNDCGRHFETNYILGQHIFESHSAENISNQHDKNVINTSLQPPNNSNSVQCNVCFKVLSSSSYLSNHMLLHSGVKPFKCDMCDMSFRFMPNLNIHKKKHKAE